MDTAALLERYASLGRLVDSAGRHERYDQVPQTAVELIGPATTASITRMQGDSFRSVGATGPLAEQADQVQYDLRSGPCVDTILDGTCLYAPSDLAADDRWPGFGPKAAALGLCSMLSFRLAAGHDGVTACLNVYAGRPHAFGDEDLVTGLLLATHATTALSAELSNQRIEDLEQALQTNREIGVAVGILMDQRKLTRSQAFDLLRIASQHSHRKVRDIAVEVGDTGELPLPRQLRHA
jgi:hypothetical protein